MKVLSVIGTRPEAVKMAPVVRLLKQTAGIEARLCVTAQHRQMLDQVLKLFELKPDYDLDLMRDDQTLAELSAAIFKHLDHVLVTFKPDWILVQGDTTSVAITALLAYYHKIKVGHVEAGLRTHDKWQPFPEEINRRVAGVVADLHFAPTEWARQNLLREGIKDEMILVSGNPVIDALQHVAAQPEPPQVSSLLKQMRIAPKKSVLSNHEHAAEQARNRQGNSSQMILVTAHRRENFGAPLENICLALKKLSERGDVEILYPVHMNPKVQKPVHRILDGLPHITLVPPMDYLPLVHLMKHARLILTDSGGIQEEAPAFGVPVLVMRELTERPEGIEANLLKLVGTDTNRIVESASQLLDNEALYNSMARAANPFGDGHAAERIVKGLLTYS
ncbi:MAG: UDP-N-acetylglucosamine 2-epimerase [Chloroflexi bacterium RBG_16_51_16]|nr:MAG: UDP-N-acetylglucosamine 2-epimerase [Chloroflexi bacterium RBG_16_51_16]